MLEHDIQNEFGIFRSMCQNPDPWSWKKMCGYLDRWEFDWDNHDFQELILPYLRDQLAHWPDDLPRFAQHHWLEYALVGREVHSLEFCTAMQFVSQDVTPVHIRHLLDQPNLDSMTFLDLTAAKIDREFVEQLVKKPKVMPKLATVKVPGRHLHKYPAALKQKATARGIELVAPG